MTPAISVIVTPTTLTNRIEVAITPGPVRIGVATMTQATSVSPCLVRLKPKMISVAMRMSTSPPAIRKASMLIPNTASRFVPISVKMMKRIEATIIARLAERSFSLSSEFLVRQMKMGRLANGSKMKNSRPTA